MHIIFSLALILPPLGALALVTAPPSNAHTTAVGHRNKALVLGPACAELDSVQNRAGAADASGEGAARRGETGGAAEVQEKKGGGHGGGGHGGGARSGAGGHGAGHKSAGTGLEVGIGMVISVSAALVVGSVALL